MSRLLGTLSEFIRSEVVRLLGLARNQELRIFFSGPPPAVLDELFLELSTNGSLDCWLGEDLAVRLPVFLLDSDAHDPDRICSARCTPSFLVKVRTSECPMFLALHPPNELSVLSLESATTRIGMNGATDDLETWLAHPLIKTMIDRGLERHFGENPPDNARAALVFALDEAWREDEGQKDHSSAWSVLRRLLDCEILDASPVERFLACLGLPTCGAAELGKSEHLKVLGKLGEFFESAGFGPALDTIQDPVGGGLSDALSEFRQHLLAGCLTSSDFSSFPVRHYRPVAALQADDVPTWWRTLTLEVWSQLLDSSPDPSPNEGLDASFVGSVAPVVRGLPFVVFGETSISLQVKGASNSVSVTISRANGGKQLERLTSIEVGPSQVVTWTDPEVPRHERYLRYQVEAPGYKNVLLKCIALESYCAGIGIYARNASKITPFKLNKKAREADGRRCERFECEVSLNGVGAHQIDIYKGSQVRLGQVIVGYDSNSERDHNPRRPINLTDAHHAVCVIETDEESLYEFEADPLGNGVFRRYRILITADDQVPTAAASEFDRLLVEHRASANGDRLNARVEPRNTRSADLQIWAIEDEKSFNPLAFGPDYLDCWKKPEWEGRPVFSRHALMLDPRPLQSEFAVPQALVDARRRVQQFLCEKGEPRPIETIRLSDLMEDSEFVDCLHRYVRSYVDWLDADYTAASWSDVITLHDIEGNGDTLEPMPYAVLLSPLHPLRLAWQCQAQRVLQEALDKHLRCPGASILDPHSFPDCMLLRCRTAAGRFQEQAFLALANTSDYWAVLWNKDAMSALGSFSTNSVLNQDFGIEVEGLTSGFGVQQVVRSIDEVSRLSSGKAALKVSIESDTNGTSSCNEGLYQWCEKSLGVDGDAWFLAGQRTLTVFDYRAEHLHPEQSRLASLTASTGAAVNWFTRHDTRPDSSADLAIVAHLGVASPAFQVEHLRSAVDPLGLTRWRVRKQLSASQGTFLAEARVGSVPLLEEPHALQEQLLKCVDRIESECSRVFDSYLFAPRIQTLGAALNRARYCAVSSSTVDASCFFRGTREAYLWDYDLPAYSRRAGENSGYYLLAKKSDMMVRAVHTAVQRISGGGSLGHEVIEGLLREISRRGMPTLKRLTGGGTVSLGEVGMLAALRILQTEFQENATFRGVAPVQAGAEVLNLVVPVDPFKNQIEQYQTALGRKAGERPDLLLASLRYSQGRATRLKITPIEVKARGDVLPPSERIAALGQASSFSQFLNAVLEKSLGNELWGLGWRGLVASWLDYAFRVYSQLEGCLHAEEWTKLHGTALTSLMNGDLLVEIDEQGRLVVIDQTSASSAIDADCDGFSETMLISHADAFTLLSGEGSSILTAISNQLGDWGLHPKPLVETVPSERIDSEESTPTIDNIDDRRGAGEQDPVIGNSASILEPDFGSEAMLKREAAPDETNLPSDQREPRGLRFPVGTALSAFRPEELIFFPGNTQLNQLNVGIVGDLGTGKTQLVQALLHQLRSRPEENRDARPNILIFDYKKDYSKRQFVEATGARVVSPYAIPLNVFNTSASLGTSNVWLERSKFFSDILDKIYSGVGPLQRQRIKQSVRDAYDRAIALGRSSPTIYDVFDAYQNASGGAVDSPYAIISDIVDGGYFVKDEKDTVPFSEFLDGIVVIDLAAIGQDDRTKNMLVVVLLNMFYEHMLTIEKRPFLGTEPRLRFVDTMLLVDEAENIMKYEFDVLKRILLQGREFGVGVILASQYLSHFKTRHENYLEPLLTWFIHKVPTITVKELEAIGLTRLDAGVTERVKTLACHECLYKTYDVGGEFIRGTPFYELLSGRL